MAVGTLSPARQLAVRIAGGYFAAQAALGVLLWVLVATWPWFRSLLELLPDRRPVTDGFGVADIGVIVVGSAATAWAAATSKRWAAVAGAFTAGAVVYPTVYLIGWTAFGQRTGWVGLALMLVVALLCCWSAWQLWRADLERHP